MRLNKQDIKGFEEDLNSYFSRYKVRIGKEVGGYSIEVYDGSGGMSVIAGNLTGNELWLVVNSIKKFEHLRAKDREMAEDTALGGSE